MIETLSAHVITSVEAVHRGDSFAIYLDIQNVFDDDITIDRLLLSLPPGFSEVGTGGPQLKLGKVSLSLPDTKLKMIKRGDVPEVELPITLRPGDTVRCPFYIRAGSPVRTVPRPGDYGLSLNIGFTRNGILHTQAVPAMVNVHPAVLGAIAGGTLGAVLGAFVRELPEASWWYFFRVLSAVIMAFILVVVLKRRVAVQSFVTVEDFWGGIIIGFAVGYGGSAFFERFFEEGSA